MEPAQEHRERVADEAALWVVRLAEHPSDPQLRSAFESWRDADLAHEVAFERESRTWNQLERLRAFDPGNGAPDEDLFAPQETRDAANDVAVETSRAPRWRRRGLALGGAVAFSLVAMPIIGEWSAPAYATAVGERRTVALADGSKVELNTASKIVVHVNRGKREVRLDQGEAVFSPADGQQAFVVMANAEKITANNAIFEVRVEGETTLVTVVSGDVQVAGKDGANIASQGLGTVGVYRGNSGFTQRLSADERERKLAWRRGVIALAGETLAQAVQEFERYGDTRIIITSPEVASLRVAGYFGTDDLPGFLKAVQLTFPIQVERDPSGRLHLVPLHHVCSSLRLCPPLGHAG